MRLFVAIPLPPDVAEDVFRILPEGPRALRRVRPELLHLTLAFLGDTPEGRVPAVVAAAGEAAGSARPFEVELARLGRFPEQGTPTTIWIAVGAGAAEVSRLGDRVRAALRRSRLEFDDKPFRPHVTLARVRDGAPLDEARAIAAAVAGAPAAGLRFDVDAVEVVRSVLSPRGPRYSSLGSLPLGSSQA